MPEAEESTQDTLTAQEAMRPLEGVRVVEVSTTAAGGYAGHLLAALGASVTRYGPVLELACDGEVLADVVAWFHDGKEQPAGIDLPGQLPEVDGVDLVLVETDTADQAWRDWGVALRDRADAARLPIVVDMAAGFLADVPVPGDSLTNGAWSGMSWSMGDADKAPLTLPFDIATFQEGLYAAAAGLAALVADPAQADLRHVSVGGRDVLAYYVGMITANFLPYERPWTRDGARPPGSAGVYPASIFPCADGHVVLMCRSQREWHALLKAMGAPDWAKDPKFDDPRVVARLHADEADKHLMPWVASQTAAELVAIGREHGLAVAPIRSMREALEEPQFGHRGFLRTDPETGLRTAGVPWHVASPAATDTTGTTTPRQWPLRGATSEPTGLFAGLRVLDLSWVWSGPLTTSVLGDLGAEIVKVEHEGHMDTGRLRGKARRGGVEVDGPDHEATPYFNQMNHGKRSLTADMKDPRARDLLLDLAEHCDVVVENMRPGVLDKLGLGYADFAARNPAIVMLSMSMGGQTGPLRTMKGYAGIMAAMSGLESLIGYDPHNIVGSLSPAIGDPNAAGHALTALLAALHRRKQTGQGSWIDLSQIEALLSVLPAPVIASQRLPKLDPPANTHTAFAPYGHYPCRGEDQWIAISVRTEEEWSRLIGLSGGEALHEPAWSTASARVADRERLDQTVAAWTATQDRDALVERLLAVGMAAAPVSSFEEMTSSAWRKDRELAVVVDHRYLGPTDVYVVPWKFGGRSAGRAQPAPFLGADTVPVLQDLLGLDEKVVADLRDSGALR
ncbi:CoA transferase [Streptomyces sp. NPDC097610]|uniref:CaiB/BaiF CoA-transferase family protein n=1 Tax=Streptomyces sp. NPDC097610 TaxID=3157227 RepID=UPI00332BF249